MKKQGFIKNLKIDFIDFFDILKNSDWKTKLSFIFMGIGCILRGQIIKGIAYFLSEIAFICYMLFFGVKYLSKLGTLGTQAIQEIIGEDGIIHYEIVDNSFIILLYSVISIFIIIGFLLIYISNIKSAYNCQLDYELKRKSPCFKDDMKQLLDNKYHITLMTLPSLGVICFTILPLVVMVLLAFTNYDKEHLPPGNLFTWVGIQNISSLFFGNGSVAITFRSLLVWTLIWAVASTFLNYLFGMLLAIAINKKGIKLKKIWRTIFVLTIAVPQFVSLLLMSQMLDDNGIINKILLEWGWISEPIKFLTSSNAKWTVILVNLWVGIPYSMLITTGILMNIPQDLYESASLDGASAIKQFTAITLPYMLYVTAPYLITQFIGNINNFNVIYLLSGGGPLTLDYYQAGQTDLLITWLFKLTVDEKNYSLASTIGIAVFIVSAIISLIAYNLIPSTRNEGDLS